MIVMELLSFIAEHKWSKQRQGGCWHAISDDLGLVIVVLVMLFVLHALNFNVEGTLKEITRQVAASR